MDGIRQTKTVNGMEHQYTTLDGKVIREAFGDVTVDYFYDNEGKPYKIVVDDNGTVTSGYYVLNQQGDVIAILNSSGTQEVVYEYNAWGRITREDSVQANGNAASTTSPLETYNALKYRGYYYDAETGFYYVSSRYYDPVIGRFISADTTDVLTVSPTALTDKNLYTYCDNNPVVRRDTSGAIWETVFDIVSLGASIMDVATNPKDPWAWIGLAADAINLIPVVTGVGETVRGLKAVNKTAKIADDTVDTIKTTKKLHRPYIRKSVRQAVEAKTPRLPDGRFLDANTKMPINGKYDLGHVYGREYWRERDKAISKGWTQKQFNDYMNNPDFYQIEDPINNRSHKYEKRR